MTAETQREFEKKLGKKVKHTWNLIGHNCLFAHADFVTNIMNQAWNPSSTENKIGRKALAEFLLTKKRMVDFFFLWKSYHLAKTNMMVTIDVSPKTVVKTWFRRHSGDKA